MKKKNKQNQNRDIGKITAISITCKDCNTIFVMGNREVNWYSKMGFPLPKRCPECRKKRREAKTKEAAEK